jgi:hypothetical protein
MRRTLRAGRTDGSRIVPHLPRNTITPFVTWQRNTGRRDVPIFAGPSEFMPSPTGGQGAEMAASLPTTTPNSGG